MWNWRVIVYLKSIKCFENSRVVVFWSFWFQNIHVKESFSRKSTCLQVATFLGNEFISMYFTRHLVRVFRSVILQKVVFKCNIWYCYFLSFWGVIFQNGQVLSKISTGINQNYLSVFDQSWNGKKDDFLKLLFLNYFFSMFPWTFDISDQLYWALVLFCKCKLLLYVVLLNFLKIDRNFFRKWFTTNLLKIIRVWQTVKNIFTIILQFISVKN